VRSGGTFSDVTVRSLGSVRLSVAEAGRGGRPLLLVHGFTGAKEDFGDWMQRFAAEGWWVVAPDQRGHGASDHVGEEAGYSLAAYAADLLALVDDLGWDRFALLGHSMGGMIAQELLGVAPERVERLVLMDTCSGPPDGFEPEVVALGLDVLRTQGLPALIDLMAALQTEPGSPSEERVRASREGYVEWSDAKLRSVDPAMYAAMGDELTSRPDRIDLLAALTIPTRVVVGAEDANFLAAAHRMHEAMPTADLVVIPDAAHCPQMENPEAWWDAVAPFLGAALLVD